MKIRLLVLFYIKFKLINLGSREAAIVTELPGTTRDLIQVPLDVSGYSVLLIDTAGIRSKTIDLIEELGMKKSKDQAQAADMVILVIDALHLIDMDDMDLWLSQYTKNMNVQCSNCLVYVNKIDVVPEDQIFRFKKMSQSSKWTICFGSCKAEKGLTDMMEIFVNCLQKLLVILLFYFMHFISLRFLIRCGNPNFEHPRCSQARHRYCLTIALENIQKFLKISNLDENIDIAAQLLHNASLHIGKITGHVSTEEILNLIFSKFCIGK